MFAGLRVMFMRDVIAFTFMLFFALFQTVSAGGAGSYPKVEYNGLSFPSYSLSGAVIDKAWEDDNWTRTLNWNGRLEPGGLLRIAGTARNERGSGPGILCGRLKVTVEVDGVVSTFNKELIGKDQTVSYDVSVPIATNAKEGRVLVELYGIYGNGQTRNIKLGGVFTNDGPSSPVISQQTVEKTPKKNDDSPARFIGVKGQVEFSHDGIEWRIAKTDSVLQEGDHIKTAEDAFALLSFGDMSVLEVKPESHIVLAGKSESESKLKLVLGHIWVNVKKMIKDGSMEVDSSQAVCGIKGTTFELWETGVRKSSIIKVTEGVVAFRNKNTGQTVDVGAGQTVSATPAGFVNSWALFNTSKEKETVLFFNGNDNRVFNGGQTAGFYLSSPAILSYIMTYHWNDGRGAPAGTITLRHEDGETVGPWTVTPVNGVYWEVRPDVLARPGRYEVIDSDPATWSQNNGAGHVRIRGYRQ